MSTFSLLRTTFNRHQLLLARLGWTAVCLLIFTLFITNFPFIIEDTRSDWQVDESIRTVFEFFPTISAFVRYFVTLKLIALIPFVATAVYLAWRRWDDKLALFTSATLLMMSFNFIFQGGTEQLRLPWPFASIELLVGSFLGLLFAICYVLLFHLFPDGRIVPRWNRWLLLFTLLVSVSFFVLEQLPASWKQSIWPFSDDVAWGVFILTFLITILTGLAGQFIKYRQMAADSQRRQTRLVMIALICQVLILFTGDLLKLVAEPSLSHFINLHLGLLLPTLLPVAIGISMLRYRLWEVDVWINRAVVYGGLTAVVLSLYGLSVGLLSNLIPAQDDGLTIFLALIVVLFIINPLHRQVQRGVGRLLPIPPQPPLKEEAPPSAGPSPTPLLRLAHMIWVVTLFYFIWLAFERLRLSRIIINLGDDYLVSESLKLFTGDAADSFIQYTLWLRIGVTAVFWFTALFIFWHKRHDWVALAAATIFLMTPFGFILSGSDDPVGSALSIAGLFMTAAFPYIFPDGRFVPQSSRWRLALIVALFLTPILTYNIVHFFYPTYRADELGYVSLMATITVFTLAAISSQIYRYRHLSTPSQRQQTKWIVLGFTASSLPFIWVLVWLFGLLERIGLSLSIIALVMIHLTMIGAAILPITFAFAILRYGLWQVDVWINRTFVFGGLTLLVTAVYILTVGLMSNLFQTGSSVALSVLATGLIAILFNPLRQRLQTAVNRLMYGQLDDPMTVLSALGKRLEETAVPNETLPVLVETIAHTLKLPYVAVTRKTGDAYDVMAAVGVVREPPLHTFPLVYQSEIIGQLLIAPRTPGEAFSPAEMRLLRNVARQAGTAVHAAQLTTDLQRSRERLVTTREEERRRIHRDLHDGLGPHLATLNLKVDAARNHLAQDSETADHLLIELKSDIHSAISDIRRLVHDLRPRALDQLGLVSALQEYVARQNGNGRLNDYRLFITFQAPEDLPPLPAAVEVATYRIALEAITNVVRHAHAQTCHIQLLIANGLQLEIRDDGVGLPVGYQAGIGLSSMRERTAELGGAFQIASIPGNGTLIFVQLPLSRVP